MDVLRHRCRSDETDGGDQRMGEQGIHRLPVSVHHIQDAVRQTGLGEKFRHAQGGGRDLLGYLEDEAVAAGDGQRKHPHGYHGGEVERGDACAYAERLAHGVAVYPATYVLRK